MQLYEFEGKQIFKENGIKIPDSFLLRQIPDPQINKFSEKYPGLVIKAQLLQGSRKKKGGIKFISGKQELLELSQNLLGSYIEGEEVSSLLVEKKLDIEKEIYLGCAFDTSKRMPCLIISSQGGIDIESIENDNVIRYHYNPLFQVNDFIFRDLAKNAGLSGKLMLKVADTFKKLYKIFHKYDCKLVELNPLILTKGSIDDQGNQIPKELIAADSVIILDDDAFYRQKHPFPLRQINRLLTENEIKAKQIDKDDHRGIAGKTFIELGGDLGVLSSGGGASMAAMDALLAYGVKPATYTEYSGNPPAEKVEKLADIVLSMRLNGLWIVGATANFTDIKVTLVDGLMKSILKYKPKYPIVIRRAGPRDKEAFEIIKQLAQEHNLDISLYGEETAITESAKILAEKVKKYKEKISKE